MVRTEDIGRQDEERYFKLVTRHLRREVVLVGTLLEITVVITFLAMIGEIDRYRIMIRKKLPQFIHTMIMKKGSIGVLHAYLTAMRTAIRGRQAVRREMIIVRWKTVGITHVLTYIMDDEQARTGKRTA